MDKYVLISYAVCLFLLFLNILLFRLAYRDTKNSKLIQWVMRFTGVIPGFLGVILSIYFRIILGNSNDGIAMVSAWLLLELGTVQLLNILKSIKNVG